MATLVSLATSAYHRTQRRCRFIVAAAMVLALGCGSTVPGDNNGGGSDASTTNDANMADAGVRPPDARPPLKATPRAQLNSAAGVISGSLFVIEAQIGQPVHQTTTAGTNHQLSGAEVVLDPAGAATE